MKEPAVDIKATNLSELKKLLNETSDLVEQLEENLEEIIVHELLHLKLFPLDQLTESLINGHYEENTKEYATIYIQFMEALEQTVEELAKCYLSTFGENKDLSFGRCKEKISYNDISKNIKSIL